jgi:glycosyltransferase involved in cell wall biosynthesis
MRPIAKNLLLVHQHALVRTAGGMGAPAFAIRALGMVTDHFAHVVTLTPVRQPDQGEMEFIQPFPPHIACKALYQRRPGQSRLRSALLHLGALPVIARQVGRADVVYVRLPNVPALLASIMALAAGKDVLVSIHGNWGEVLLARRGPRPWWRVLARAADAYQRALARRSVLTMVTGEHTRSLGGASAVIISQHQFESGDLFERADTCASRPVKLLYVGLLSTSKGTDHLLDALARLVAEGVDCTLTLAGLASGYDAAAAIARRGLGDRVTMAGFVRWGPELFGLYRASDVFVFPSLSEGSPKAPMEALSQSLPVVATRPGTSGYVEHEHSGLLVPTADPAALAAAIRRMIDDGALRRRCIAGGLEVARRHTRDRMYERIRQALTAAFATSPGMGDDAAVGDPPGARSHP